MAEPIDTSAAVDGYLNTPSRLGAQARMTMADAVGGKPDYEAQLQKLARQTGVPVDTVRAYPDEMGKQATLGAYDFDKMAEQFPNTAKFLGDPAKAAVGHDESGFLSTVEGMAKFLVSAPGTTRNLANGAEYLGKSIHSGLLSLTGTAATLANNIFGTSEADLATLYKRDPLGLQDMLDNSPATAAIRFGRSQQQGSEAVMDTLSSGTKAQYGSLKYATMDPNESALLSPIRVLGDALQSLPSSAAMGLSVYLTKGAGTQATAEALAAGLTPQAAKAAGILAAEHTMARMGASSEGIVGYGQQYNQTREDADKVSDKTLATSKAYKDLLAEGYTPSTARTLVSANAAEQAGQIAGIVDAAVNFVGGKFLGRIIGEGGSPIRAAGKGGLTEAVTEGVQSPGEQFGQNLAMQQNMDPTKDLSEGVLESMVQGLAVGGLTGGAMAGVSAVGSKHTQQIESAKVAEQHAEVLGMMQKTVEASKLLERSPDTLRSYMQDLADQGVPNVFIDSAALVKAGVDMQALAQAVPSVAAQMDQIETGGDLVIPTGELLVNTAGSEFSQSLMDHARTSEDAMSRAEAKVFMQEKGDQLNAEIDRVLAEKSNDTEFKAGRDEMQATVKAQLDSIKRFTPAVNEQYAALTANFYAVMAARTGMTVQDFANTYKLGFAGQKGVGAQVLDQTTPAFQNWFGDSKVVDAGGKPLVMYHGTNADFSTFKANDSLAGGIFFSPDAKEASAFAFASGANVIPVYLAANKVWPKIVRSYNEEATFKKAKAKGYDAVRVRDSEDGAVNWVVFNPTQIKSATGNNGNYDPANASILEQSGYTEGLSGETNGRQPQQPGNGSGRPEVGGSAPLAGAPSVPGFHGPDPRIVSVAEQYAAANGIDLKRQDAYVNVDPERAARIAQAYTDMVHAPNDPAVKEAYAELIKQTTAQYQALADAGYKFHFIDLESASGQAYASTPWNAMRDTRANQQMGVFSTEAGFGTDADFSPEANPMLADTGLMWPLGTEGGAMQRVLANDLFRAVHDAFGHGIEGAGFRAQGEENAWQAHSRLFTGSALGAITTETRGQNSRLNYGPYGESNRTANVEDTKSADQKTGLMPEWTWTEGRAGDQANVMEQPARGQIAFADDITRQASIISIFKNADLSTFIHESGHFFLEVQADLAARIEARITQGETVSPGERSILDDMNTTLAWMGVEGSPGQSAIGAWLSRPIEEKRPMHEKWARGFEAYAFEGKAPSLDLQKTFQTFRAWLVNVYRSLLKSVNASKTDIADTMKVELSPEVRSVMDRMLATSNQINEAEAARDMGPLFKTAEEAGMTAEEYKAYHDNGVQATLDAVDDLQAKGLKDMQWLHNARSRKLKELQKQHNALRTAIGMRVRSEVLSQPIYRAWTFLTAKGGDRVVGDPPVGNSESVNPEKDNLFEAIAKLGGLDREDVKKSWGIDEKESLESGLFGKPVVRKTGGKSIDAMAEYLAEEGYILPGRNDQTNIEQFEALFDDQRRGTDRYALQHDMAAAYGEQPMIVPELPEMGAGKLRTQDLRDAYGTKDDAVWRKLSALRMTSDTTGLHPDVVAELFGFGSGDELVKKLADVEPPKSVIEGMTDQRMLEENGDLATPAGIERAADAAIHNDARARFVATELAALQKAMNVREKVPGQRNTVDVLARAARDYAEAIIAKLKVRDVRPGQYAAAANRSGKAATKAGGDIAQATMHKRNQLINVEATRAAYAAQDEVKAAVAYFRKFDTVSKTLDVEYADQIYALLERFDLRQGTSLKAIDKRASLVEWVQSQTDQGLEPDIPPALLQEANRKSFKEMTVEEIRGLRDTIKQIEHLGRLKNKLLTSQANRDFAAVAAEILDSIDFHAGDRQADTRTPNTLPALALIKMKNFWASHIKVATWARVMDGGKDGGPVWEYLVRTANISGDREVVMKEKATRELAAIVAPVLKEGKMGGKGIYYAEIGKSLNKEARLAIALNLGNAGNQQRLLGGEGWTIEQLQPVLKSLTAADWKFVQSVWDHFETYRPEIGAKEKRIYGREPNWIEAVPVQTDFGMLRGGYYPVKYDPRASERAESHAEAEDAKRLLAGAYTSATTRRSFTKARAEEVNGRPLLLSLDGIYNGVQEVIHDLTWHEWLIDANKIIKNKKISAAMREKYGPEVHQQFKRWLEDNAAGDRGAADAGEMAASWVRQGVSVSGLGLNVMSALMQPLGLTQSIVRIGPKWVGKGVLKMIGSPLDTTDEVNGKSEFMRTRSLTQLREIAEVRSQVKGRSKAREAVDSTAYFLMMRAQQLVDTPTWWGAYEKAIAGGNDEARAVALSDQAVIDSQGSGGTKDQSAIERGGPYLKLFTTFYSFFNTALNLGVQSTMTEKNKAKLAANYLMLYSVPAILGAALKDAMTPGDSGDWDDPEKLIKRLIGEQLSFLFGLMVGVREMGGAAQALTGTEQYSTDYSGPAGLRFLGDAVKLAKQLHQGEMDDGLRKAVINTSGELLRLPSAQVNRVITGAQALSEGKTQNPGALLTGFQEPR